MALKSTTRKATRPAASPKTAAPAKPVKKTTKTAAPAANVSTRKTKAPQVTPVAAAPAPAKPIMKKPSPAQPVVAKAANSRREVTFTYFAPEAATVLVAGDFTKWESSPIRLVKETGGQWKATVALKPGKYQYRLLVDGNWQNDPACPEVQPNEFGSQNCVLSVAA